MRPDDLAAQLIRKMMEEMPELDKERIDDLIVGNAMPEAEQGLNVGRLMSLMALDTVKVPGMTVNRYCSSGLETIAIATATAAVAATATAAQKRSPEAQPPSIASMTPSGARAVTLKLGATSSIAMWCMLLTRISPSP
jgi:acetyl-CoA acetyltransferase